MSPDSVGPLSRPIPLHRITTAGIDETIVANAEECAALARDLGLPAIHTLSGRFRLTGSTRRVRVTGRIEAAVEQTCVVTLDAFPTTVSEDIEVEFEAPPDLRRSRDAAEAEVEADLDRPDELVGDSIDLGAIAAEFLALGLDPHPRKPGVAFAPPEEPDVTDSPFAGLARLRPDNARGS